MTALNALFVVIWETHTQGALNLSDAPRLNGWMAVPPFVVFPLHKLVPKPVTTSMSDCSMDVHRNQLHTPKLLMVMPYKPRDRAFAGKGQRIVPKRTVGNE